MFVLCVVVFVVVFVRDYFTHLVRRMLVNCLFGFGMFAFVFVFVHACCFGCVFNAFVS